MKEFDTYAKVKWFLDYLGIEIDTLTLYRKGAAALWKGELFVGEIVHFDGEGWLVDLTSDVK